MRDLTLTFPQFITKRKTKSLESTWQLNLALLVGIIGLGLAYLFMVNSLGTKGYEIRKLDLQLRQVEAEQKVLQLQASDLQSINRIQTQAQQLNFVPATNVTYLKASDFALK
jgi:hypothetical protein